MLSSRTSCRTSRSRRPTRDSRSVSSRASTWRGRSRAPSRRSGRSPAGTSSSSTTTGRGGPSELAELGARVRTIPPTDRGTPLDAAGRLGRRRRRPVVGLPCPGSRGARRRRPRPPTGRPAARRPGLRPRRRLPAPGRAPRARRVEPARRALPVGRVPDPGHPLLLDVRLARRGPDVPRRRLRSDRRGGRTRPPAAAPQLQRRDLPPPARRRPTGILTGRRWYPPRVIRAPPAMTLPNDRLVSRPGPARTRPVPEREPGRRRDARARPTPAEADAPPGDAWRSPWLGALAVVAYGLIARDATQVPMLTAGEFMTGIVFGLLALAGAWAAFSRAGTGRAGGPSCTRSSAASRRSSRRAPSPRPPSRP